MADTDFLEDFHSGPLDPYRKQASFDWKKMAIIIEEEKLIRFKHKIWRTLEKDPLFAHSPFEPTLDETRRLTTERILRIRHYDFLTESEFFSDPRMSNTYEVAIGQYDWSICVKMWVMYEFFMNAIRGMGTAKHFDYIEAAYNNEIFGCVALTEISHGTNTRQIRTKATFNSNTQTYTLHTPDFEAAKCWAGGLGKTSTHAFVYAQLYTADGSCHGLHCFIVPIRDVRTMLPFPGVRIGDMGSKCGLNGIDNGFMLFDNYVISKDCLLNKNGEVTSEGQYVTPFKDPNKRFGASLGNLSAGRCGVMGMCAGHLCTALPIAIRYSAVRRQFGNGNNGDELPVLEYQMQQWRLLPYLAGTYILKYFSDEFFAQFVTFLVNRYADNGDIDLAMYGMEIHAVTSSGKPLISWLARDAVQECREACGGHGYLKASGLGRLRNDNDANCTYEGENNVLLQQTSNWLLGIFNSWNTKPGSVSTRTPLGTLTFLSEMNGMEKRRFVGNFVSDVTQPAFILSTYKWLICYLLKNTAERYQEIFQIEQDAFSAKNDSQAYYARTLSLAFIEHYVIEMFWVKLCGRQGLESNYRDVLTKLVCIYGLWSLEKHLGTLYEGGFAQGPKLSKCIRQGILQLCLQLKPEAVALADAIAPPDFILNSAIGHSDGTPYKHLELAMSQTPGCYERPSWWKNMQIRSMNSKL